MINDDLKIIDGFLNVCKAVHPDFKNAGTIMAIYNRNSFDDLFGTIAELYYRLVAFHIPTKYLNIDITDDLVRVKLDYKGLKLMFPQYGKEEEDEE